MIAMQAGVQSSTAVCAAALPRSAGVKPLQRTLRSIWHPAVRAAAVAACASADTRWIEQENCQHSSQPG